MINSLACGSPTTWPAKNKRRARTNHRIRQTTVAYTQDYRWECIGWNRTRATIEERNACLVLENLEEVPTSKPECSYHRKNALKARCRRKNTTLKQHNKGWNTPRSSERHTKQRFTSTSQPVRGTQSWNSKRNRYFNNQVPWAKVPTRPREASLAVTKLGPRKQVGLYNSTCEIFLESYPHTYG